MMRAIKIFSWHICYLLSAKLCLNRTLDSFFISLRGISYFFNGDSTGGSANSIIKKSVRRRREISIKENIILEGKDGGVFV